MVVNLILYITSIYISIHLVLLPYIPPERFEILSMSAVVAVFGTALITLADIIERDKLDSIKNDIEILYRDILKTDLRKQWNFMRGSHKLVLRDKQMSDLLTTNSTITFGFKNFSFTIHLPIVLEDIFDFPVFSGYLKILFNRKRYISNYEYRESEKESLNDYYKFLCVADILRKAVILRISRYFKHFSIGLIFGSIIALLRFFTLIKFPIPF